MSNEVMTTVSLAGGPKATLVFNVSTACLMSLVSIIMVAVMHLRRRSKYFNFSPVITVYGLSSVALNRGKAIYIETPFIEVTDHPYIIVWPAKLLLHHDAFSLSKMCSWPPHA